MKTKIAIFDLTGCQGCEFHLLSLDELLLDLFQDFEITNWRLLTEVKRNDFDIAFIEGAATTKEHIKLLKKIRETSKIVVALGACAISGNVFVELTPEQRKKLAPKIYDENYKLKAKFLEPVENFIKIDEKIQGCPPDIEKFKELLSRFKDQKITSKIEDVFPLDYVAKIEGHGRLKIDFQKKEVEFEVEESERLVEGLLLGRDFRQAPMIASRICGICPVAHNLCSWKVLEKALGVRVSLETVGLREMLLCAQMIKSHLLHLFFLVLPDFAGLKGSIELSQKYPAEFHLMLNIKRVSEKIMQIVGGSTIFPTNTTLGGFLKPPTKEQLFSLRDKIFEVIDESLDLIKLFAGFEILDVAVKTSFLTTSPLRERYPLYQSEVTPEIKEIVKSDSTAKLGVLKTGEIVKVGSLARMAAFSDRLNPKAKKAFGEYGFSFKNPFNNNLAQAVEILHFLEEASRLIEELVDGDLNKAKADLKPDFSSLVVGEACLEAPRGVLIHRVELTGEGKIKDYNIVPPTQINLACLEKEAQELVDEGKQKIEELIRAFDPCITCAVH